MPSNSAHSGCPDARIAVGSACTASRIVTCGKVPTKACLNSPAGPSSQKCMYS